MKGTIIMVAIIATFLLTWMFVGALVYLLSDIPTYKQCMVNGPMTLFLIVFGWIPSIIVAIDLDDRMEGC